MVRGDLENFLQAIARLGVLSLVEIEQGLQIMGAKRIWRELARFLDIFARGLPLTKGHIDALVVQNPRKMGYLGVKTMVSHLKGETVEKRIDTGAEVVTKANMGEPNIAELLAPPKG